MVLCADQVMSATHAVVLPLLLPTHTVGGGSRGRGRPVKVETKPTRADLDYHAEIAAQREEHVATDEVLQAVVGRRDPKDVLQKACEALAREAAVLEHHRKELEKRGRDVGQIVSRRAKLLVQVTQLQLRMGELSPEIPDLTSPVMLRVFRAFLEKVSAVAASVLPSEQYDVFFNKLENELHGWDEEMANKLR